MDDGEYGVSACDRICVGESAEYSEAETAQALQDFADVSLGDARLCFHPAVENSADRKPESKTNSARM